MINTRGKGKKKKVTTWIFLNKPNPHQDDLKVNYRLRSNTSIYILETGIKTPHTHTHPAFITSHKVTSDSPK